MGWAEYLQTEFSAPYYEQLQRRLLAARQCTTVYPPQGQELAAFALTPPEAVRVVILGQDPYHGEGQAMGLSFSVPKGTAYPPSLRNIFKELSADLGLTPKHGDLSAWARQGVLLLNTVLTVESGKADSHATWGWQRLTDAALRATNELPQPIAFVLWGAQAQSKAALVRSDAPRLILTAPHPSPLSAYRGFFGSRPFSQVNAFLRAHGEKEIDWSIE